MNKGFLKSVSLALIQTFIVQQIAFAAPEIQPIKIDLFGKEKPEIHFTFPESVGEIEDSYLADRKNKEENGISTLNAPRYTLFLFQDAHTNESGQFNLSKALDIVLEKEGIKHVFVEAGFGDSSLPFFKKYGTPDIRREVAVPFVKQGVMHGEEFLYLSSQKDFTIWGVEDFNLYKKSIETYAEVAKSREKYHDYLKKIKQAIDTLSSQIFNPLLLSFNKKVESYEKNDLSLTEYFKVLFEQAKYQRISLKNYPNLKLLNTLSHKESRIDFKKATEEQAKAIESLGLADQKELLELAQDKESPFKISNSGRKEKKAFYALLQEKLETRTDRIETRGAGDAGGESPSARSSNEVTNEHGRMPQAAGPAPWGRLNSYPELSKYFQYLKLSRKIEAKGVLKEIKLLEAQVFDSLAANGDEKTLLLCSKNVSYLDKLFDLTLTPEEFDEYKSVSRDFDITKLTGFLNKKIMDLNKYYERTIFLEPGYETIVQKSEEFYTLTYQRDIHFMKEAIKKMEETGEQKAVLISGGYHSPNLKALLKTMGVSYICVTPQILKETNHKRYEKILLGQEFLKVAPPSTVPINLASATANTAGILLNPAELPQLAQNLAERTGADTNQAKTESTAAYLARLAFIEDEFLKNGGQGGFVPGPGAGGGYTPFVVKALPVQAPEISEERETTPNGARIAASSYIKNVVLAASLAAASLVPQSVQARPFFNREKTAPAVEEQAPQAPVRAGSETKEKHSSNIWLQGEPGEYHGAQWQARATYADFNPPVALKEGQTLTIKYDLEGSDVVGIQLIPVGVPEDERGDMIVKRGVGGTNKTITITVPSDRKVWRIAFQYGKNAWGSFGGSYNANMKVYSIEVSGARMASIRSIAKKVLVASLIFFTLVSSAVQAYAVSLASFQQTVESMAQGILSLENPQTHIPPSHYGHPGFEDLAFLYDQAVNAMVLKADGQQAKAEQILDYFASKLPTTKAKKDEFKRLVDTNNIYGIVKIIQGGSVKAGSDIAVSFLNALNRTSTAPQGAGQLEWWTTPGPTAFMGMAFLQVNKDKYLPAAIEMGNALLAMQREDGGITDGDRGPGKVHTEPHMDSIAFLEMLGKVTGDSKYTKAAERGFEWFKSNVFHPKRGVIDQGYWESGPSTIFATDAYSWTMAGPAGDRVPLNVLSDLSDTLLEKSLTKVTLELPDGTTKTVILVDFTDPKDSEAMSARNGFHPMGSVEWVGGVILALQKNAVRFWNAGGAENQHMAQLYKAAAEILTEQSLNAFYGLQGLTGKFSFYATGQWIPTAHGWNTPYWYVKPASGKAIKGGSLISAWPALPIEGFNPFILGDNYKKSYDSIPLSTSVRDEMQGIINKAVANRSFTEQVPTQAPTAAGQIVEPGEYNKQMWAALGDIEASNDGDYKEAIRWATKTMNEPEWVRLAKRDQELKAQEIGGLVDYPWSVPPSRVPDLERAVWRYPLLNEMGAAMFGLAAANFKLGNIAETKKWMNRILDDVPYHQIYAPAEFGGPGYWNAIISWYANPGNRSVDRAMGKVFREVLQEREAQGKRFEMPRRMPVSKGRQQEEQAVQPERAPQAEAEQPKAASRPSTKATGNLWLQGEPGEYHGAQWQARATYADFNPPVALKEGQTLTIKYDLVGSDVVGIQLIPVGVPEDARGDMIVKHGVEGTGKTITITVPSDRKVWRIAFQYGKNAWGSFGGSYNANMTVYSIEVSGARVAGQNNFLRNATKALAIVILQASSPIIYHSSLRAQEKSVVETPSTPPLTTTFAQDISALIAELQMVIDNGKSPSSVKNLADEIVRKYGVDTHNPKDRLDQYVVEVGNFIYFYQSDPSKYPFTEWLKPNLNSLLRDLKSARSRQAGARAAVVTRYIRNTLATLAVLSGMLGYVLLRLVAIAGYQRSVLEWPVVKPFFHFIQQNPANMLWVLAFSSIAIFGGLLTFKSETMSSRLVTILRIATLAALTFGSFYTLIYHTDFPYVLQTAFQKIFASPQPTPIATGSVRYSSVEFIGFDNAGHARYRITLEGPYKKYNYTKIDTVTTAGDLVRREILLSSFGVAILDVAYERQGEQNRFMAHDTLAVILNAGPAGAVTASRPGEAIEYYLATLKDSDFADIVRNDLSSTGARLGLGQERYQAKDFLRALAFTLAGIFAAVLVALGQGQAYFYSVLLTQSYATQKEAVSQYIGTLSKKNWDVGRVIEDLVNNPTGQEMQGPTFLNGAAGARIAGIDIKKLAVVATTALALLNPSQLFAGSFFNRNAQPTPLAEPAQIPTIAATPISQEQPIASKNKKFIRIEWVGTQHEGDVWKSESMNLNSPLDLTGTEKVTVLASGSEGAFFRFQLLDKNIGHGSSENTSPRIGPLSAQTQKFEIPLSGFNGLDKGSVWSVVIHTGAEFHGVKLNRDNSQNVDVESVEFPGAVETTSGEGAIQQAPSAPKPSGAVTHRSVETVYWAANQHEGDRWKSESMNLVQPLDLRNVKDIAIHVGSATPGAKFQIQLLDKNVSHGSPQNTSRPYALSGERQTVTIPLSEIRGLEPNNVWGIVIHTGQEFHGRSLNPDNRQSVIIDSVEFPGAVPAAGARFSAIRNKAITMIALILPLLGIAQPTKGQTPNVNQTGIARTSSESNALIMGEEAGDFIGGANISEILKRLASKDNLIKEATEARVHELAGTESNAEKVLVTGIGYFLGETGIYDSEGLQKIYSGNNTDLKNALEAFINQEVARLSTLGQEAGDFVGSANVSRLLELLSSKDAFIRKAAENEVSRLAGATSNGKNVLVEGIDYFLGEGTILAEGFKTLRSSSNPDLKKAVETYTNRDVRERIVLGQEGGDFIGGADISEILKLLASKDELIRKTTETRVHELAGTTSNNGKNVLVQGIGFFLGEAGIDNTEAFQALRASKNPDIQEAVKVFLGVPSTPTPVKGTKKQGARLSREIHIGVPITPNDEITLGLVKVFNLTSQTGDIAVGDRRFRLDFGEGFNQLVISEYVQYPGGTLINPVTIQNPKAIISNAGNEITLSRSQIKNTELGQAIDLQDIKLSLAQETNDTAIQAKAILEQAGIQNVNKDAAIHVYLDGVLSARNPEGSTSQLVGALFNMKKNAIGGKNTYVVFHGGQKDKVYKAAMDYADRHHRDAGFILADEKYLPSGIDDQVAFVGSGDAILRSVELGGKKRFILASIQNDPAIHNFEADLQAAIVEAKIPVDASTKAFDSQSNAFKLFAMLYQRLRGSVKGEEFNEAELAQVLSGVVTALSIILRYAIPPRPITGQEIQVYEMMRRQYEQAA